MSLLFGVLRILAVLLILAAAIPAILALFGFAVPFFDLFNHLQLVLIFGTLAALIAAIALRLPAPVIGLAALGLVASAWTFVPEWVSGFAPELALPADRPVLKLMTHNIFGLNDDMKRAAAVIAQENPDIIALQEYFPEQAGRLDALLKPNYPYSVRCRGGKRANLGLYSKLPFDKEMTRADCPDVPNGQRTAHIVAGFTLSDGTHFSVLTTHMDWPFPIERQAVEFAGIEDVANGVNGPLLVVGDFNSTPWSYALKGFEAGASLTRMTRGIVTYPLMFTVPRQVSRNGLLSWIPFLPLDQVFERGLTVAGLHRAEPTGSDHLPIVFSFSVAD